MKFHKSIYAILAVFFLMTKVGFAFNLHFCGGQLATVSAMFSEKGCGMEMMAAQIPSCDDKMKAMSCCSDEVILIQNHDENPIADSTKINATQMIAVLTAAIVLDILPVEKTSTAKILRYQYDSHAPPLYELYCSYTFYG